MAGIPWPVSILFQRQMAPRSGEPAAQSRRNEDTPPRSSRHIHKTETADSFPSAPSLPTPIVRNISITFLAIPRNLPVPLFLPSLLSFLPLPWPDRNPAPALFFGTYSLGAPTEP